MDITRGPVGGTYPPNVRSFALTVNFYSPRAYDFLRQTFKNKLPHQRTLQKWYESVDGRPGCTGEALTAISLKVSEARKSQKHIICSLVMDEIAIRQHVSYSKAKNTYYGYVDFGNDFEKDSENREIAKDALTFVLVAINDNWKIPVAYFLVHGLTSLEKKNILEHVLVFLSQADITICSITFDGASSNLVMCKHLGANLKCGLAAFFDHPVTKAKTFLFLDICHMLKLVRNTFASKLLIDGEGNLIVWRYIDQLEKLQRSEFVLLANKLTKHHIEFSGQKMKTKFAAQTLSISVAASLDYLRQTNPDFKDSEATSKFVRLFDQISDILNSKSKFGRYFKRPINNVTAAELFQVFKGAEEYIKKLKIRTERGDVLVLESRSFTGFNGFLIAMENVKDIYRIYCLEIRKLQYIITFKFSQDYIETLFSAIRSKSDFNNNPSALQFESAYKRLLVHNEIKSSSNANCSADGVSILTVSYACTWKKPDKIDDPISNLESIDVDEFLLGLNLLVKDVVTYIAGYVERHIRKVLKCNECLRVVNNQTYFFDRPLIECKDWGGLCKPGTDIVKICQVAEKKSNYYRLNNMLTGKNFYNSLLMSCIREINFRGIFVNLDSHVIRSVM